MDNTEDKITLIVEGLNLRGRCVPLHTQNPRNPERFRPDTIRIKDLLLSFSLNIPSILQPSQSTVNLAVISGKRDIFNINVGGIRSKSLRIPRILCVKGYPPAT
jgi:hypothetical protein